MAKQNHFSLLTEARAPTKPGRPNIQVIPKAKPTGQQSVNLDVLEALANVQCSMPEMAAHFSITVRSLQNLYKKDKRVKEIIDGGRLRGQIGLKRAQFKSAINGSAVMQIWLGKQYLDQRDQPKEDLGTVDTMRYEWVEPKDELQPATEKQLEAPAIEADFSMVETAKVN